MSYLNTVPLVWGMLHGPQREDVDLSFSIPSVCAEELDREQIEVGLVPVAEIARQGLDIVPGVGISCLGAVRSILLFSRVPWRQVRTLAADRSSRTSVELARVILRERYGVEPQVTPRRNRCCRRCFPKQMRRWSSAIRRYASIPNNWNSIGSIWGRNGWR